MTRWLLSAHNSRETFGAVSYPINASYFRDFSIGTQIGHILTTLVGDKDQLDLKIPLMLTVQARMYFNISHMIRNAALIFPFDPTSLGVPSHVEGLTTSQHRPRLSTQLLVLLRFARFYRQVMRAYQQVVPRCRAELDMIYWQLRGRQPGSLTEGDLSLIARLFEPSLQEDMTVLLRVMVLVGLLNIGLIRWLNQKAPELLNLLAGRGTSTAQLGERMWELGQVAVQAGPATAELLRRGEVDLDAYRAIPETAPMLETFHHLVRTYGHRAFHNASEIGATRIADQPELVLLTVGGLLEESEPPAARAEAARQVSYRALRQMNPLRRFFWASLLKWGSSLVEKREDLRDGFEVHQAACGLVARLLSRHHFPDLPEDTLLLYKFDEFLAFGQSRGRERVDPQEIEWRRSELEQNRQQPAPPELIWYDPEAEKWWAAEGGRPEESVRDELRLQGIGASAGSGPVAGVALVAGSAQEAAERLLAMTGPVVLVTYVTDPVWSSMFRRLTAVVTEIGGVMSHAATVARENGIPAVVGVTGATQRITDGQYVRVDGAAGTLEIVT